MCNILVKQKILGFLKIITKAYWGREKVDIPAF